MMELTARNLNQLYFTLNSADKSSKSTEQILDSLRVLASRAKKRQCYAPGLKPAEAAPLPRAQFYRTTARSADKAALLHEATLRKDLIKFRSEVESRFRNSEVNRLYQFPRTKFAEKEDSGSGKSLLVLPDNNPQSPGESAKINRTDQRKEKRE